MLTSNLVLRNNSDRRGNNSNMDSASSSTAPQDASIIATADDAWTTKHAAVQAGYLDDPFLSYVASSHMKRNDHQHHIQPLIKRGTHARVCCMDRVVTAFLRLAVKQQPPTPTTTDIRNIEKPKQTVQVVVLGAGRDTTYLRLRKDCLTSSPTTLSAQDLECVAWYEVDQEAMCCEKAQLLSSPQLPDDSCPLPLHRIEVGFQSSNQDEKKNGSFFLIIHDLRKAGLFTKLESLGFDRTLPTLFLSECVQMYMPVSAIESLLQSIVTECDDACLCSYEPIVGRNSSFGAVMERNLVQRRLVDPSSGLLRVRSLAQHLEQLHKTAGFDRAIGCDLWSAYETVVTPAQRQRANRAEFMDELEEFILIMQHYCITVAGVCRKRRRNNKDNTTTTVPSVAEQLVQIVPSASSTEGLGFVQRRCQSRGI